MNQADQIDYVIQNYLLRLTRRIYPSGDLAVVREFVKGVSNLLGSSDTDSTNRRLQLISLQTQFSYAIPAEALQRLIQTVDELLVIGSKDELASYLITLEAHAGSVPRQQTQSGQRDSPVNLNSSSFDGVLSDNTPPGSRSGKSLYDRLEPYRTGLSKMEEPEIVRSLVFALTGSTSNLFPYHKDLVSFPTSLNFGEISVVYQLLEPCLVFKKLSRIANQGRLRKAQEPSQTEVAFMSILQDQMLRYTDYLNNSVSMQIIDDEGNATVTLRELHLRLSDWINRLKFLNFVELVYEESHSNEFLSLLDRLRWQGDPTLRELSLQIFHYCGKPFAELVRDWTLLGELNVHDSKSENFFVERRAGEPVEYHEEKVPSCVSAQQAYIIYQIGKCLDFLKNDCKEIRWCEEFKHRWEHTISTDDIASWNFEAMYREIVHYCYRDVLCDKHNLVHEMLCMQKFLLVGQGDFINSIALKGKDVLSQSSASLSAHLLIQVLMSAIDTTSLREIYDRQVIDRLDARILALDSYGTVGWEVFTLDFQMNPPLDKLFENDHKEYMRMFNFMFKLVRLNFLLNEEWSSANAMKRQSVGKIMKRARALNTDDDLGLVDLRCLWITKTFKRLNILRNEFIRFMNVLTSFIDVEVIERHCEKFMADLQQGNGDFLDVVKRNGRGTMSYASVKVFNSMKMLPMGGKWAERKQVAVTKVKEFNLDQLTDLHREYIRSISRCLVLDNENPRSKGKFSGRFYIEQIHSFLDVINKFVELNGEFNNLLLEMLSITGIFDDADVNKDRYDDYLNQIDVKFNRLMENLTEEIINKFEDSLEVFTKDLLADRDERLRGLGMMLSN